MAETLFVLGALGATVLGILVMRRVRVQRLRGTGVSPYSDGWWVAGHGAIGGSEGEGGSDCGGGGGSAD